MKEIIIINYDYISSFCIYDNKLYSMEDLDKSNLHFKSKDIEGFVHYDFVVNDTFDALGVDKINYIDCGDLYTYVRQ